MSWYIYNGMMSKAIVTLNHVIVKMRDNSIFSCLQAGVLTIPLNISSYNPSEALGMQSQLAAKGQRPRRAVPLKTELVSDLKPLTVPLSSALAFHIWMYLSSQLRNGRGYFEPLLYKKANILDEQLVGVLFNHLSQHSLQPL